MNQNVPLEIAFGAFKKHKETHPLEHYTGILALQGLAHLAVGAKDERIIEFARSMFLPFARGERKFDCNFKNYLCGGNGSALLLWKGHLPEAEGLVRKYAEELLRDAPRDRDGIFCTPAFPEKGRIWIDAAFAVTPFLLYSGLALNEDRYIEEAFQQTVKMFDALRDPENGLLHQCKNFNAHGRTSEDHWSRGNGWGMLAIAELIDALPQDDPRRPEAERIYREFVHACLKFQDEKGLWHHEMTMSDSFTETSGSGLLLYGIGVGLLKGCLPNDYWRNFMKGLQSFLQYIDADGTVHNTCQSCRNPGDGSIAAYLTKRPIINDTHSFGPVILAFGVAVRLGLRVIESAESSSGKQLETNVG